MWFLSYLRFSTVIQQNKKQSGKIFDKIVVLQRFVRRTFEIQTTKHNRTVNQCKTLHHPNVTQDNRIRYTRDNRIRYKVGCLYGKKQAPPQKKWHGKWVRHQLLFLVFKSQLKCCCYP